MCRLRCRSNARANICERHRCFYRPGAFSASDNPGGPANGCSGLMLPVSFHLKSGKQIANKVTRVVAAGVIFSARTSKLPIMPAP